MTSVRSDGRVTFRFYRPGVAEVKVVGSFNEWDRTADRALCMTEVAEGWWQTETAAIEPGEHRFRYVADGNWYTDFASNGIEKNKYGWNSILIVPERRMTIVPSRQESIEPEQDTRAEAVAA
jgi:1,4-alpha-glucan branching enzyme